MLSVYPTYPRANLFSPLFRMKQDQEQNGAETRKSTHACLAVQLGFLRWLISALLFYGAKTSRPSPQPDTLPGPSNPLSGTHEQAKRNIPPPPPLGTIKRIDEGHKGRLNTKNPPQEDGSNCTYLLVFLGRALGFLLWGQVRLVRSIFTSGPGYRSRFSLYLRGVGMLSCFLQRLVVDSSSAWYQPFSSCTALAIELSRSCC